MNRDEHKTARPPIAQFGDAIEVKGERPGWLPDDVWDQVEAILYCGEVQRCIPGATNPVMSDWEWGDIESIKLPVPRYDFVYLALERGMVPWFGGDEAPVEAKLVDVLYRDGRVVTGLWAHRLDWFHYTQHSTDNAIIGYHATSTALPLAHPAAVKWRERWYGSEPQKGSAILDERGNLIAYFGGDEVTHTATTATVAAHNAALAHPAAPQGEEWAAEVAARIVRDFRPEGWPAKEAEIARYLLMSLAALAPAAIASGREGACQCHIKAPCGWCTAEWEES